MLKRAMMDNAVQAAIGLGGNLGDPKAQIQDALAQLNSRDDVELKAVSNLYETAPWGNKEQPTFLNICALIETKLSARQLLDLCLTIEQELGRVRDVRWGPRAIDLDVLFYGSVKIDEDGLQLPHPRMTQRAFVMVPLADIAPNTEIEGRAVQLWAENLKTDDVVTIESAANWWQPDAD